MMVKMVNIICCTEVTAAQVIHAKHDHSYTHKGSDANDVEEKESMVPLHLTNALYRNYIGLNLEQRKDLETAITFQKSSSVQP